MILQLELKLTLLTTSLLVESCVLLTQRKKLGQEIELTQFDKTSDESIFMRYWST
jgi:hypothetical protein